MEDKWLSIQEYAQYTNKSISTVRRYIKKNKVRSEDRDGKYYILVKNYAPEASRECEQEMSDEIMSLKKRLMVTQEELYEAKMLISIYENQLSKKDHYSQKHINE